MTKKSFIVIAIVLGIFNQTIACDCPGQASVKDAVKSSDIVITGQVLSKEIITVKDAQFERTEAKFTVLVLHKHKGEFKADTLAIVTGMGGGDCGYYFETGKKYIIYGSQDWNDGSHKTKGLPANTYRTTLCTRTALYNDSEFQELKKITN